MELEQRVGILEIQAADLKSGYVVICQSFAKTAEVISNNSDRAIQTQANSLSIPLLKDVLIPIVMKLFAFFALLTMGILGSVIGIKWIATDILGLKF